MDDCGDTGGDEGPEGDGSFRVSRQGKRGGTDAVDEAGEVHCGTWKESEGKEVRLCGPGGDGDQGTRFAAFAAFDNFWIISESNAGLQRMIRGVGGGDRQEGDGTEAGIVVVDKHVRLRGGRTKDNRRSKEMLGHARGEKVRLVMVQTRTEWEVRSWHGNTMKEGHELVFQRSALAPQPDDQFEEEM